MMLVREQVALFLIIFTATLIQRLLFGKPEVAG